MGQTTGGLAALIEERNEAIAAWLKAHRAPGAGNDNTPAENETRQRWQAAEAAICDRPVTSPGGAAAKLDYLAGLIEDNDGEVLPEEIAALRQMAEDLRGMSTRSPTRG